VGVRKKRNWRDKLHPTFFELAEVNRKFEVKWKQIQLECKRELETLGPRAPAELREKVVSRLQKKSTELMTEVEKQLVEINRRYPQLSYNPLAYSHADFSPGQSAVDEFVSYLHWMRHRESLQTTSANDARGDITAWRKLARTGEDFRRIAYKKGSIKSFQGDTVHRQLLELILCFEVEPLTAEERAECVDHYCACGETHDADALKKQYARLRRELQACVTASVMPTPRRAPKIRK